MKFIIRYKSNINNASMNYVIVCLFMLMTVQAAACTMAENAWQEIYSDSKPCAAGYYAISDALYQLRIKFDKEICASGMASGPINLIGAFCDHISAKNNSELYGEIKEACACSWPEINLIPREEMMESDSDFKTMEDLQKKYAHNGYTVTLLMSDSSLDDMKFIDMNWQRYVYLKFVLRENLKLYFRAADSEGIPVFLDEAEVSPTLIIQPYLSPWGGFIYVFEKNNTISVQVSFGTMDETDTEHRMLVCYGNNQKTIMPEWDDFKSDLEKSVDKKCNKVRNLDFFKQLMQDGEAMDEQMEELNKIKLQNSNRLVLAVTNLDLVMLKDFLEEDSVGINNISSSGKAPLQAACQAGIPDMVSLLLEKGADPMIRDKDNKTAMHYAVDIEAMCLDNPTKQNSLKSCPLAIPEMLIKAGGDVNAFDSDGYTSLHYAARNGLVGIMTALINSGANVNAVDFKGNTPLHLVNGPLSKACAQVLLNKGANQTLKNNEGLTPFDKGMKEANAGLVNAINEYNESKKNE